MIYADDLTLLADFVRDLQKMLDKLAVYAKDKGFTVNVNKCQVMVSNPNLYDEHSYDLPLNDRSLERVSEFKYLGVVLNEKGRLKHASEYAAQPFCRDQACYRNW